MPKKKTDDHITDAAAITAALLRIYEPLLDAPLPEDHTGPDPEYHNRTFDIAFQAIIGAVHRRFEGAEEYLSRAEKNYSDRIEDDPKMQDIRTVFASEAEAKAQKAFTAAVEMRKALSDAYELMTGKVFDRAEWQASFDSAPGTSKSADRAKAAAKERAAAIAKRKALSA